MNDNNPKRYRRGEDLLDTYLDALERDLNAAPPPGLEPDLAAFARALIKYDRDLTRVHLPSADRRARIWADALATAKSSRSSSFTRKDRRNMQLTMQKSRSLERGFRRIPNLLTFAALLAVALFGLYLISSGGFTPQLPDGDSESNPLIFGSGEEDQNSQIDPFALTATQLIAEATGTAVGILNPAQPTATASPTLDESIYMTATQLVAEATLTSVAGANPVEQTAAAILNEAQQTVDALRGGAELNPLSIVTSTPIPLRRYPSSLNQEVELIAPTIANAMADQIVTFQGVVTDQVGWRYNLTDESGTVVIDVSRLQVTLVDGTELIVLGMVDFTEDVPLVRVISFTTANQALLSAAAGETLWNLENDAQAQPFPADPTLERMLQAEEEHLTLALMVQGAAQGWFPDAFVVEITRAFTVGGTEMSGGHFLDVLLDNGVKLYMRKMGENLHLYALQLQSGLITYPTIEGQAIYSERADAGPGEIIFSLNLGEAQAQPFSQDRVIIEPTLVMPTSTPIPIPSYTPSPAPT